jgi:hypothetical protein
LKNRLKTGFDLVLLLYPASRGTAVSEPVPQAAGKDCLAARMEQLQHLFNRAGLFMENRQ